MGRDDPADIDNRSDVEAPIRELLRVARKALRMSQEVLGESLGRYQVWVSKRERKLPAVIPTDGTLARLTFDDASLMAEKLGLRLVVGIIPADAVVYEEINVAALDLDPKDAALLLRVARALPGLPRAARNALLGMVTESIADREADEAG
jgi:transcriptional regulator with XRE-family HTH domain